MNSDEHYIFKIHDKYDREGVTEMSSMYRKILVHGHMPTNSVIAMGYLMNMDTILTQKKMIK